MSIFLKTVAILALVFAFSPAVNAEDSRDIPIVECPSDGGGSSGGGEICICGCGTFANGSFWDCSPNGCDAKEGKACEPTTKAPSRKSTADEQKIIAKFFPQMKKSQTKKCIIKKY